MWRRIGRVAAKGTVVVGVGAAAFDYYNCNVLSRSVRTLYNGAKIAYLYKTTEAASLEELSALHTKVATMILTTCLKNEGLYIKFGQGLSAVNHILPPEYVTTLQVLLDNAPQISKEDVFRIVEAETGRRVDQVFEWFDEVPVASASIAQVHKAGLKFPDGSVKPVAVKVQKPNIPVQIYYDLACHRIIVHSLEYLFGLPMTWSAKTIEDNLLREIDFVKEADNARRVAEHLKLSRSDKDDVYVPIVYSHDGLLSTKLMVAEWIDGVKMSNVAEVKAKFDTKQIMQALTETVGDMIFRHGTVHSDLHAGNIFIRHKPSSSRARDPQVVLIDFGLCIDESAIFRHEYASLFRAIFTHDVEELRTITKSWGIAHADLFASMQLMKPFSSKKDGANGPIHKQRVTKRDVLAWQLHMKDNIRTLLENDKQIPKELIFVGRAMNLLRAVNKSLDAPVNRVNILAERAVASLPFTAQQAKAEAQHTGRTIAVLHETTALGTWAHLRYQLTLTVLAAWFYFHSLYHLFITVCVPRALREKMSIVTLEEQLEAQEKDFAQRMGSHPLPRIATND